MLHDTDRPTNKDGSANSAWAANQKILEAVAAAPAPANVRLAASVVDFEHAMFGTSASSDKPFRTVMRIRKEEVARKRVKEAFDYLLFETNEPPAGVLPWTTIDELERATAAEAPVEKEPPPAQDVAASDPV